MRQAQKEMLREEKLVKRGNPSLSTLAPHFSLFEKGNLYDINASLILLRVGFSQFSHWNLFWNLF